MITVEQDGEYVVIGGRKITIDDAITLILDINRELRKAEFYAEKQARLVARIRAKEEHKGTD